MTWKVTKRNVWTDLANLRINSSSHFAQGQEAYGVLFCLVLRRDFLLRREFAEFAELNCAVKDQSD